MTGEKSSRIILPPPFILKLRQSPFFPRLSLHSWLQLQHWSVGCAELAPHHSTTTAGQGAPRSAQRHRVCNMLQPQNTRDKHMPECGWTWLWTKHTHSTSIHWWHTMWQVTVYKYSSAEKLQLPNSQAVFLSFREIITIINWVHTMSQALCFRHFVLFHLILTFR